MTTPEKRHSFRDSLLLSARCRFGDAGAQGSEEIVVKLRNISAQGLMAEGPQAPLKNARVWLDLPNLGWVDGRVAWVQDNRFGIFFAREIDPAKVRKPLPEPQAAPTLMPRRPLSVRLQQIGSNPSALRRV